MISVLADPGIGSLPARHGSEAFLPQPPTGAPPGSVLRGIAGATVASRALPATTCILISAPSALRPSPAVQGRAEHMQTGPAAAAPSSWRSRAPLLNNLSWHDHVSAGI